MAPSCNRLFSNIDAENPVDVRDHAILILLSIYGFRSGEVARLTLEHIDWSNDLISVPRSKQRSIQTYPLLPIAACSIIRYLQQVRHKNAVCREVFLTLTAPFLPLSKSALYNIVNSRIKKLKTKKNGPHALRHACATHLVGAGLSLKEVGDHLGHKSSSTTRIYAKVNLPALREVAQIDLEDILG